MGWTQLINLCVTQGNLLMNLNNIVHHGKAEVIGMQEKHFYVTTGKQHMIRSD